MINSASMKRVIRACAVSTVLALAACGGDDNGSSNNSAAASGNPGGSGTSAPAAPASSAAITFAYQSVAPATSRAQFIANANSEGAQGFHYLSDFGFAGTPAEQISVFVKDAGTTWSFEAQNPPVGSTAFLTQANAEGARGFRWAGLLAVNGDSFYLYRKDNGSQATYTYQVLAQPTAKADYLTQINTQGASGFYNVAPFFSLGDSQVWSIYEKSSAGSSTYGYEIPALAADDASFTGQLNSEGARGFRFRTELFFSDGTVALYVKDLSQASSFSFAGLDPATSGAAFVQQANSQGANGSGLVGGLALPSGKQQTFYFTPAACTGMLCTAVSLFGI
jgi:hypothetical protein